MHLETLEYCRQMISDGASAEEHLSGNGRNSLPAHQSTQDLPLPRGQLAKLGMLRWTREIPDPLQDTACVEFRSDSKEMLFQLTCAIGSVIAHVEVGEKNETTLSWFGKRGKNAAK